MIIFAMALRSKASSNNWMNVVKNFNLTLKSLFNQTDPNFMVYVGCNEIPELYEKYDDRLKFFSVELPPPPRKNGSRRQGISSGNILLSPAK